MLGEPLVTRSYERTRVYVCPCVCASVYLYLCICVCGWNSPPLSGSESTDTGLEPEPSNTLRGQSPSDPLAPTMVHNSKNSANIWVPTVYNQKPVGAFFIQIIPNWATENEGAMVQRV